MTIIKIQNGENQTNKKKYTRNMNYVEPQVEFQPKCVKLLNTYSLVPLIIEWVFKSHVI